MKRLMRIFVALFAAFTSTAFASVHTDYDHAAVFSQFHTYSWGKIQTKNDLWADRVREDIDQQLQRAGWQRVVDGGDIILVALADSRAQQEEQTFYTGSGLFWGGGMTGVATTSQYTTREGILVISMFDTRTKKLVWRGTATGGLSDNPDKNIGKLSKAASKMFKNFPPKP